MTIVEQIHTAADVAAAYSDWTQDNITLKWEDRRQGHGRRRSDNGLEFAISLPAGALLKDGDCLLIHDRRTVISVRAANEPVYIIRPRTPQEWAFYAYQVGNRHQTVMIGEHELVFLQNPAVLSLLQQMHVDYASDLRPFTAALATSGHTHE
jgi:urease accessory protein